MPVYRIYRLRDSQRNRFRWAPHTSGVTSIKRRDYEEAGTADAATPYAAWRQMKETDTPLALGDVLEHPDGALSIYKYVGFEQAQWTLPEIQTGIEAVPTAVGQPSTQAC